MAFPYQADGRQLAPAPAPAWTSFLGPVTNVEAAQPVMLYACQQCANRKIKCDKAAPICSKCRKGRIECIYQAPPPRRKKRRLSGDDNERLARYERILRQHDLLPPDEETSSSLDGTPQEQVSLRFNEPETSRTGKLLAGQGKSRYVSSNLWRNFADDEMQHMSEDDEDDQTGFELDPLTTTFMGYQLNLIQYHPNPSEAAILWRTHIESVEPLCKILHIPSTREMVERVSQQPQLASKAEECLLFSIYHFAVFSMTDVDCAEKLDQSKSSLMQKYQFATRQALVNASFLKTTEMSILQALVLFLLPCRYSYDAHTYWILTGVAVRIAQRMGLHRDGEKLGLPPFETQMRRRLFYQIVPLDGIAAQVSGTGIAIATWDTQQPLNVNDDQIWPGMTEEPRAKKGATDMIFCLARYAIGKYFAKPGGPIQGTSAWPFKDYIDAESTITEAESEVEENYIRYCDIVNPLHFLTICQARSAITAMRLRVRLPKVRNQTATVAESKEILQLAQKIIDTDTTACANVSLKKYIWHVRSFFAWGSWDSLIFVLSNLRSADLLSPAETSAAWDRIEQVYDNRNELLESKRALHIAVGRLALKAWNANPSSGRLAEPAFITALRSKAEERLKSRAGRGGSTAADYDGTADISTLSDPSPSSDANALYGCLPGGMGYDLGTDFSVDTADWMFWDQLIRDYHSQGAQQQSIPAGKHGAV